MKTTAPDSRTTASEALFSKALAAPAWRRQLAGARLQGGGRHAALHRARRRRARVGRRRQRAPRLRRRLGPDDPRPSSSGRRRRGRETADLRIRVRRTDRARGRDGSRCRSGDAVDRDGALRELGHRGDDGGAAPRARGHESHARREVRRLLSRSRRQLPGEGGLGRGDLRHTRQPGRHRRNRARHADGAIQRCGQRPRLAGCPPRRGRRDHRRARRRQHGRRRTIADVPQRLAASGDYARRVADLRRGDDRLPRRARRCTGAVRRHART